MDIGDALEQMRDPLGAPFYPSILRVLLVLTWVVHIFFVTLALGSGCCAIYGFLHKGERQLRLARSAARVTPNAVGFGIVTGIAPLLFLQTIYDPIWYASNTLTGFWSVMFVFVVMGGYGLAYLFYMRGSRDGRLLWSTVASTVLICFAGWIMHVLASVSIRPDSWREWYAPNGIPDTRGVVFHAFNLPRLVFLLPIQAALSLAVVGLLHAWYMNKRGDADSDYLSWVAALARRLGIVVSVLAAAVGLFWGVSEGAEFQISPALRVVFCVIGGVLVAYFAMMRQPERRGPQALGVWLASLTVVAVMRELIRTESLTRFGYRVSDYPYVVNWGSAILFIITTVMGLSVIAYMALILFQSGLQSGNSQISSPVERFGKIATGMLGAWFGFFLLLGLYTVLVLN